LIYAGIQTFENAKRRYEKIMNRFVELFDQLSVDFMGDMYVQTIDLRKVLKDEFK
jgi:hypothetical protein